MTKQSHLLAAVWIFAAVKMFWLLGALTSLIALGYDVLIGRSAAIWYPVLSIVCLAAWKFMGRFAAKAHDEWEAQRTAPWEERS